MAFPIVSLPGDEPVALLSSDDDAPSASAVLPGDEASTASCHKGSGKYRKHRKTVGKALLPGETAASAHYGSESDTSSDSDSVDGAALLPGDVPAAQARYSDADIDEVERLMASMAMGQKEQASSRLSDSSRRRAPKAASRYEPTPADIAKVRNLHAAIAMRGAPTTRMTARQAKIAALQRELNAPRAAARTTVTQWRTEQTGGKSTAVSASGGFAAAR